MQDKIGQSPHDVYEVHSTLPSDGFHCGHFAGAAPPSELTVQGDLAAALVLKADDLARMPSFGVSVATADSTSAARRFPGGAMSGRDRNDLIEFLKSLTDEEALHDRRWANPW